MLRYFLQPHPTFGSYKNPVQHKVEASPYYWWWLALTMSDEYTELCAKLQKGAVTAVTEREQQMLAVYKDFGDVRYEGGRHAAFAYWWTEKVGTYKSGRKISRGEKLFAEAQTESVHKIYEPEHAAKIAADERFLVLAIPKINDKKNVLEVLEKIVNKHFESRKGRDARNPKFSTALYPLSRPTVPSSISKAFKLLCKSEEMKAMAKRFNNADLAEMAGVEFADKGSKADGLVDKLDIFEKRRSDGNQVTRYMSQARKMIDNTAIGIFP